jgi:threonyl-tRNA synthetase
MQRVPYQLITGDKELENQTVAVRTQQGEDLGSLSLNQLIERLKNEITDRK